MLFLLHTIFPNPLRLYVDTLARADRAAGGAARADRRRSARRSRRSARRSRRRRSRSASTGASRSRPAARKVFAGHVRRKLTDDRDNDYLRPWRLLHQNASEWMRARAARPFYDQLDPERPFVYFPLHVTDDYKIQRIIPHCADQASLVEQVADALPPGHDLVLKEHPMSLGRNSIRLLHGACGSGRTSGSSTRTRARTS